MSEVLEEKKRREVGEMELPSSALFEVSRAM